MITMTNSVKDQTQSGLAMPTSAPVSAAAFGGRAATVLGMATGAVCAVPTYVVLRDRDVAGDARITGAFPGLTAWSPPTC